MGVPTLRTERLTLRPFTQEDLDELARLLGDEVALRLWGGALTREESRGWIESNIASYETHGIGRCPVIWRETGELVGDCGLMPTQVEGTDEIELGWVTRADMQGRGIATEAAMAWRDHALGTLRLERIVSMVSARNPASRRVAEKLGMTVERPAVWGGAPMLMYVLGRARSIEDPGDDR